MFTKMMQQAKEGLRNLFFAKLRSSLALLGVLVGTASVVAMVLGGNLATHEALKQFKSLGTDLLALTLNSQSEQGALQTGSASQLTLPQALSLQENAIGITNVAPYTQIFYPLSYQGETLNGMVLGVTQDFADLIHIPLQAGRFISMADQYQFFCVVGKDIADVIATSSLTSPIGQRLLIGKQVFTIVGVAQKWEENSFVYANINQSILIPIKASTLISPYATINNIIFRVTPNADIDAIEMKVAEHINGLLPGKQVTFRSAKELIIKMKKQSDILTVFLGLIASISLIVGGIGVMNIMLVSVVERKREIGIRMAVGATRSDIQLLFLMEAIMLSLVGGTIGVLLGIMIAYFIALSSHWEFTLFWWPPIAGFTVSVLVGIFFGYYPAYLASKLNPIEALRSD